MLARGQYSSSPVATCHQGRLHDEVQSHGAAAVHIKVVVLHDEVQSHGAAAVHITFLVLGDFAFDFDDGNFSWPFFTILI